MPEWVDTQKQANQHRDERMMEINQINNAIQGPIASEAPPMTLESLVKGRWAQYLSERELKPSTVYSYDSVLRTHILPELGAHPRRRSLHSTCLIFVTSFRRAVQARPIETSTGCSRSSLPLRKTLT